MNKILIVLLVALVSVPWQVNAKQQVDAKGCVILLHGLGRSELSMVAIEWRLSRQGYTVINASYPSLSQSIETLSYLAIEHGVAQCEQQGANTVNFVTHSLGGILVRHYLSENTIGGLGQVVMLGPPNQGSQLADYIKTITFLDRLQPEAGRQLGTDQYSILKQLGTVDFELGIIAGNKNGRPLVSHALKGASDGTVLVEETKVSGMSDFLVLPATHTFMMWKREVLDQVVNFLKSGQFDHG